MIVYADFVMAKIDGIMKDCARGLFGEDWAIQKINALTEAYTVYQKSLRNVDVSRIGLSQPARILRKRTRLLMSRVMSGTTLFQLLTP